MADSRDAPDIYWVEPEKRGILPLPAFHLSKSLGKTLKSGGFETTADAAFHDVLAACAQAADDRPSTWINAEIEEAVHVLFRSGWAHSIECWQDDVLVGGLYGIALGRAFFGESMFSRATDASKVALAHLVARLKAGGYTLLDCQFITPHLASLGAVEITRRAYRALLEDAIHTSTPDGDFNAYGAGSIATARIWQDLKRAIPGGQ